MSKVQKIDVSSSTIFRIIAILLGVWFLFLVRDVIVMLLAAFVVASAIEPVARRLQRYRIPRALSVVIVYVIVFAVFGLVISLMVPALVEQTGQLVQSLPQVIYDVGSKIGLDTISPSEDSVRQGFAQFGERFADIGLNIFQQTRMVFSGIISTIFVFIIALYLVIEEDALKKLFRYIVPQRHVAYTDSMIDRIQQRLGRWVLAQLALGLIIGVTVGIGLWLLGVPYALPLGLLAGVLEIIPLIGPIVAGVVAVVIAMSQSVLLGLITLAFYVIIQQIENHALIPSIMRKATGLNPLVTIIAVLLGARLAGLIGVILSIPTATIISIIVSDLFSVSSSDDELAG